MTKKESDSRSTEKVNAKESKKISNVSLPSQKEPGTSTVKKKAPTRQKKQTPDTSSPKRLPGDTQDESLEEVLEGLDHHREEIPEEPTEESPASFSQRRKQYKQQQREQELSAMEIILQKSGMSEEDISMIFELGYENELGRIVGYDNLKKLKNEYLRRNARDNRKHDGTAPGYRGTEYADAGQKESVLAAYAKDRVRLILRVAFTSLLTLLLLLLDLPHLVGAPLTNIALQYPLLFPTLSLLALVAVALISRKTLWSGLLHFLHFEATPYSVCAVMLPPVLIYDVVALFLPTGVMPVNFLAAVTVLITLICDVFRLVGEVKVFKLISEDGVKTVLEPSEPVKKKLRRGDSVVKIVSDDMGSTLYRVGSARQAIGFFRRFNTAYSAHRGFNASILTAFSLATLLAFGEAVHSASVPSALSAFMTVFFLSLPCTAVLAYVYSLFTANRLLGEKRCALVGNEAIEEYDCKKTVIFRDSDLFETQKQAEISIREDSDFRRDFQLCGMLFRKLGGPLGQLIAKPRTVKEDPPVSVIRISGSGVEAMAEDRYHLLAGNDEFLRRNGIAVPKESTDKALRRTPNVAVLYVAVDGVLKLSFEIEYNCKPAFEQIISDLSFCDTVVGLHTYDPNLNDAFVPLCRPSRTDPVCVIKPTRYDTEDAAEVTDTGAVALDEPMDIVYPIHAATGVGMVRRFCFRMQIISAILGASAAVLLTVLGQSQYLNVFSIVAYQLFWLALSLFSTHFELNRNTLRFRK